MKDRLFLSGLVCIMCTIAMSQTANLEYRPFAEEGKVWGAQVGLIMENDYVNQVVGDTLINGERWLKVYNYIAFPNNDRSYYASIRDAGKKVYAIAKGSKKPRLLYDFSLKKGDVVRCGLEGNSFGCLLDKDEPLDTLLGFRFRAYLKVEDIDTIEARGFQHRRFKLSMLDAYKNYFINGDDVLIGNIVWIEGVGSGAGPFSPWMPVPPRNSCLQSCRNGNVSIFAFPDFYEAQVTNDVENTRSVINSSFDYYDLQGRYLTTPPAKGIYVKDGQKVIVK